MAFHLHAFTIVVPDYDPGIAFYCGVLGFDLKSDIDLGDGKRWVLVKPKGTQTAILLAKATATPQTTIIGNQTGGRVGFFLHTDNFTADHAMMLTKGVCFEEFPRHEPYGSVAVFRDPFGNRWDLLQLS
ncbi:MAG: VOC family protein [Planktomarina sp.]